MANEYLPSNSNQQSNLNQPDHTVDQYLDAKQAMEWMGINSSSFYKLITDYSSHITDYIKYIPGRGKDGKKLTISKAGLMVLANIKDKRRDKATVRSGHTVAKKQIAEKAIEQSEFGNDPFIQMRISQLKLEKRLKLMENDLEQIKLDRAQAREQLTLLPPPTVRAASLTTRQKIKMRINDYVAFLGGGKDLYQDVRSRVNKEMSVRYGRNFRLLAKNRGVSFIDVIEQEGLLEEMYAVATELLKFIK